MRPGGAGGPPGTLPPGGARGAVVGCGAVGRVAVGYGAGGVGADLYYYNYGWATGRAGAGEGAAVDYGCGCESDLLNELKSMPLFMGTVCLDCGFAGCL